MAAPIQSGLPPASGKQQDNAVVFLSYAREDTHFPLRLADVLRLNGIDPRGDWELLRGEAYERQCCVELERAAEQEKRILPVVFMDVSALENELPKELSSPQWTHLRSADDFVAGVQGLVEAVIADFDLNSHRRRWNCRVGSLGPLAWLHILEKLGRLRLRVRRKCQEVSHCCSQRRRKHGFGQNFRNASDC